MIWNFSQAIIRLPWILALAVLALPTAGEGSDKVDPNPMTTVENVDLQRYTGLWHEVARIPNRFQKQCARGTTAEYTLREDGRITVINRCVKQDGEMDEAEGEARVVDSVSNAQLKVSFVSFLGWRPFWGDYWILGLDPEYQWAAVGESERKYGWILARTPTLEEETLDEIFQILERNGYRQDQFEMSAP